VLGSFHIIEGLVALFRDQVFIVRKSGLVVNVDYTAGESEGYLLALAFVPDNGPSKLRET